MPSATAMERICAIQVRTGDGVSVSMVPNTFDDAMDWDRNGTPMVLILNASMARTRAATTTLVAPPSRRSITRTGTEPVLLLSARPRPAPRACPIMTRSSAVAMTAASLQLSSDTQALTRGMAKNAATAPAPNPMIPPSVTRNPFFRPAIRYPISIRTRRISRSVKPNTSLPFQEAPYFPNRFNSTFPVRQSPHGNVIYLSPRRTCV